MIIPILIYSTIASGLAWLGWKKFGSSSAKPLELTSDLTGPPISKPFAESIGLPSGNLPPEEEWPIVEFENDRYAVAPRYIAPMGIGEAVDQVKFRKLDLPSPGLVDAIWKAADLKVEPHPRNFTDKNGKPEFTMARMNAPEVHAAQERFIDEQLQGQNFKLLAGTHKDIVKDPKSGKIGLYGWHRLTGRVIQSFFPGHGLEWKDYSQGLRLVRKLNQDKLSLAQP